MDTEVKSGIKLSELEELFAAPAFSPTLLVDEDVPVEADWPAALLVAAVLGIAIAIVIYICTVCQARSFDACMKAVVNYWGRGC